MQKKDNGLVLILLSIFSLKRLINTKDISFAVIIVLFVISIFLFSAPVYMMKINTDYDSVLSVYVGLDDAVEQMLLNENIKISSSGTLKYSNKEKTTYGVYEVIKGSADLQFDKSCIYLRDKSIRVQYYDAELFVYEGDYKYLIGFDSLNNKSSQLFIMNTYMRNMENEMAYVTFIQFVQLLVSTFVITALFQLLNLKQQRKKIDFMSTLKYIVITEFHVGLIIAFLSLIQPEWALFAGTILLLLRCMQLYYYIFNPKNMVFLKEDIT